MAEIPLKIPNQMPAIQKKMKERTPSKNQNRTKIRNKITKGKKKTND